jgi:hypothetical protein
MRHDKCVLGKFNAEVVMFSIDKLFDELFHILSKV